MFKLAYKLFTSDGRLIDINFTLLPLNPFYNVLVCLYRGFFPDNGIPIIYIPSVNLQEYRALTIL